MIFDLVGKNRAFGLVLSGMVCLLGGSLQAAWGKAEFISDPAFVPADEGGPVLDVNGCRNAVAVWATDASPFPFTSNSAIQASSFTHYMGWSKPEFISSLALNAFDNPIFTTQGDPDVALNASNYAVAVWEAFFNDGECIEPGSCACPGVIVASTRDSSGTWSSAEVISSLACDVLATNVNVALNNAGTAIAAWKTGDPATTTGNISVSLLPFGGVWTAPLVISNSEVQNTIPNSKPSIAINEAGDVVVAWWGEISSNEFAISVATFNAQAATWSAPVILEQTPLSGVLGLNPRAAIDAAGNAIVVWQSDDILKSASFNGTSWGTNLTIATDVTAASATVVMDCSGNATVVWASNGQIFSASKPRG